MTRVHTVTRAGRRQRSASVRTNQKKPSFKIVKEVITQEKKKFRTVASYNAEPPDGYSFIPVGYPDLTELCKKKCQDQNLQFQTVNATPKNKANLDPDKVSHHIHRVGNHFPTDIVQRACHQLGYWVNPAKPGEYKKYNVGLEHQLSRHRHKDEKDKIRSAIQELFPHLPAKDLKEILHHAFRKGSMRVGNADMPLIRRVQLAVSAHARHNYTDYDQLLKKISWGEARQAAEQPTLIQLKKWRGEDFDNRETEQVLRETIVLDSESDDDSDAESSDTSNDTATRNGDRDVSLEFVSHNTYGDERGADRAHAGGRDAYIAPSRRQAEYQALNALHQRENPSSYRTQQHMYDRLQPPPLVPIRSYHDTSQGAGPSTYLSSSQALPGARTDYHSTHLLHDRSHMSGVHGPSHQHTPGRYDTSRLHSSAHAPHEVYHRTSHNGIATAHTASESLFTDRTVAPPAMTRSHERIYERQTAANPAAYDPAHPHIIRELTPDRVLASVEMDPPYRLRQQLQPDSPPPGPRLITDRNGQSVVVSPPSQPGQRMPPSHHVAVEHSARASWPYASQPGAWAPEAKRRRLSPRALYQIPPTHAPWVDLTEDDSPRRRYYPSDHPEYARDQAIHPTERRDPNTGRRYQLVPLSNHDPDRASHASAWVDGAADGPHYVPASKHDYSIAPASREPLGYDRPIQGYPAHKQPRLVPVERDERHEPRPPLPQSHRPDDAMRSLYDEREPQQPRKASKKHHANRPRYHDHDSSALRQQEQTLDYT